MPKSKYARESYQLLLPTKKNRKTGFRERGEKIIPQDLMRAAAKVFWQKRGYSEPPGATTAGVVG